MTLSDLAIAAVAAAFALLGAFLLGRKKQPAPAPVYVPPVPDPELVKEREEEHRRAVEAIENEHKTEENKVIERAKDRSDLVHQPDQLDDFLKEVGDKAREQ